MISRVQADKHALVGGPPFYMGAEPIGMWLYRAYGVPWIANDIHERLKSVTQEEYEALDLAHRTSGALLRWNGSPFFPAADSGRRRTGFRGEAEQGSGLIPNTIPG